MTPIAPDELARITGYKRRSDQLRWLRAHGIEPFIGRAGLIVYAEVLADVQRVRSGLELQQLTPKGPRPNLTVVR